MPGTNRILLWLLGLLGVILAAWYAYWFATNFEQRSKEVRTDISPEARKNSFLAAEHFLKESGMAVQSHSGRDIFSLNPSTDDTIVLGGHSSLFLQRNNQPLLEWVMAGGNLILVPDESLFDDEKETEAYLLQEQLGVELLFVDEEEAALCEDDPDWCDEQADDDAGTSETDTGATDNNEPASADEDGEEDPMVTVTFQTARPGEYQARFLADRYLFDGNDLAEVLIGDPDMPNLLRYSLDNGTVTVLSDMNLFTNNAIGKYDHAYLFHQLVKGSGKVWIFYSADMPSLLALLWKRVPYLLLIAAALLLLAGWRMLSKSGPQLIPQYEARRNLLEHLDASAEYGWRIDKARQLFADNRHAIEQAWHRRHPQLNNMDREACCEWIGEQTGITAGAIERSLYSEITSEQDFIRASAVMQRLATKVNHVTVSAPTP